MNRKGQISEYEFTKEAVHLLIALFLIGLILGAFVALEVKMEARFTNVDPEMKAEFVTLRFANIPECFAYEDPVTGRVYPGVVDIEKFTEGQLFDCYHTAEVKEEGVKEFNFRLTFSEREGELITNHYYHNNAFVLSREVLVLEEGVMKPDKLIIFVQVNV